MIDAYRVSKAALSVDLDIATISELVTGTFLVFEHIHQGNKQRFAPHKKIVK
jgi:hypothetical protein